MALTYETNAGMDETKLVQANVLCLFPDIRLLITFNLDLVALVEEERKTFIVTKGYNFQVLSQSRPRAFVRSRDSPRLG